MFARFKMYLLTRLTQWLFNYPKYHDVMSIQHTNDGKRICFGGKMVSKEEQLRLIAEAKALSSSLLLQMIADSMEFEATKRVLNSNDRDDLLYPKIVVHTVATLNTMVEQIKNLK
jgi:hypothetical protein